MAKLNPFRSLQALLLGLVLLSFLPSAGLLVYAAQRQRQQLAQEAAESSRSLLAAVSRSHQSYLDETRQLLATLSQVPEVRRPDDPDCGPFLASLLNTNPIFLNLGVIDLKGNVRCTALPADQGVNLSDRTYFTEALASESFAIGAYQIGRITGQSSINFGYPVRDELGQINGVVFAALDLGLFPMLARDLHAPEGTVILVLDRTGVILARYPDHELWVGRRASNRFIQAMSEILPEAEASDEIGLDGVGRYYSRIPIVVEGQERAHVLVGVANSQGQATVTQLLLGDLAWLTGFALLMLAAAGLAARSWILERVWAIVSATEDLAGGDASARTQFPEEGDEISRLGAAFDRMADSLNEAGRELVQAEARYRRLVEQTPGVIYSIDFENGQRQAYLSPQIETLMGASAEEIMGSIDRWKEYLHPDDRQGVIQAYRKAMFERGAVQHEFRVVRPDGSTLWIQDTASVSTEVESGRRILQGVVMDVTARKLAEAALLESEARYRTVVNALQVGVIVEDSLGAIVAQNEAACRILGLSADELLGRSSADPGWMATREDGQSFTADDHPIMQTLRSGEPRHGVVMGLHRPDGELRWLSVNTQLLPGSDGTERRMAIASFQDITERRTAAERLMYEAARSQALAHVAQRLNAQLELDVVLQAVCEEALGAVGADVAAVALFQPEKEVLVYSAVVGLPDQFIEQAAPVPRHIFEMFLDERGDRLIVEDALAETRFANAEVFRDYDLRSLAGVAMLREGELTGVLLVATQGERHRFTEDEIALLSGVSDQAMIAIENARLLEGNQRRLEQLQALREIDLAISSSLDLNLTLNVILSQVIGELGVDAADILLVDKPTTGLRYAAGRGFRTSALQHTHLRMGQGYAGEAALTKTKRIIEDLPSQPGGLERAPLLAAEHFISYVAVPLVAKGDAVGVLEVFGRDRLNPDDNWSQFLDALAGQAAIAIDNARLYEELQHSNLQLSMAYDHTLEGWSRALDLRDKETEGHTQRVTRLTERLALELGVSGENLVHMRRGALLHDIGKMGIPDRILLKPGKLTDDEWALMKRHPQYAYDLLSPIEFLKPALDIPYCHHEKWDGSGYPRGLQGEQIPLAARIFAVADVWDALRSDRPYREAWTEAKAREHIADGAGAHFDPRVVETFLKLLEQGELRSIQPIRPS